jgi:hypothetical protein
MNHDCKDLGLAPVGKDRILWADDRMRVLRSIGDRFKKEKPLMMGPIWYPRYTAAVPRCWRECSAGLKKPLPA